jgi:hypothetical protein
MQRIGTLMAAGFLATASAAAQDLKPGDPAPPLAITEWVQGGPIEGFEKGKVYLIEFWATW